MTNRSAVSQGGLGEVRLSEIFLFVTLFAFENFACLIPGDAYMFSVFKYSDIGVGCALVWSLWVLIRNLGSRVGQMHYIVPAFLAVVSICLSAISAYEHFGQPVVQGILPFRRLIVAGIFCFALCAAIRTGLVSRERLIVMLYIIGTVELILFTAQAVLAGHVTFLQLDTDETRFGMVRLRVPYLLTTVLGIFSFNTILNGHQAKNSVRLFHILFSVWSILLLGFVAQHRAPTLILVVTYILAFLLWRGGVSNKVIGIAILCMLVLCFSSTELFQSSISGLMGRDTASQTSTLSIRREGQAYYLQRLQSSPLVGFGIPNDNYPPAVEAAGEGYQYYLADNGIFGFAYQLGLFGLVWLAILYISAVKRSIDLFRRTGSLSYFQYFLFEIGNLYMGMHWFYYYPLPFMIVFVLLDTEEKEIG
jgi:hypothetical protein